jgi:hypothetical protein
MFGVHPPDHGLANLQVNDMLSFTPMPKAATTDQHIKREQAKGEIANLMKIISGLPKLAPSHPTSVSKHRMCVRGESHIIKLRSKPDSVAKLLARSSNRGYS